MRILIFGPNGSGKGTQSAKLVQQFQVAHVESGGIFRQNIKAGTELGKKAKAFIDQGALVPDDITIPMVLDRLSQDDCRKGWVLDGFPRNRDQAQALLAGLAADRNDLDAVIVIELDRAIAKMRLLGRRTCPNGHPNNTAIEPIAPVTRDGRLVCWKCGAEVTVRKDDIDEHAIDIRLDIYFDGENGTLGSVNFVADWAAEQAGVRFIRVDGSGPIEEIRTTIQAQLVDE